MNWLKIFYVQCIKEISRNPHNLSITIIKGYEEEKKKGEMIIGGENEKHQFE